MTRPQERPIIVSSAFCLVCVSLLEPADFFHELAGRVAPLLYELLAGVTKFLTGLPQGTGLTFDFSLEELFGW